MSTLTKVDRRGFLGTMFSAGALILASRVLPPELLEAADAAGATWHHNVYLGLETDGTVIIVAHRSEMGTGIRSALPMVVADELDADWKRVKIEQAIGDRKYGDQNTDGSRSIVRFYEPMREAGATLRLMLERAAAAKWNVPVAECKAVMHQVVHSKSGNKLGYGELAAAAAALPVPKKDELKFKSPSEYRFVGKDVATVDLDDLVTGKGTFGFDAKRPGMVHASIERSPVYGGKVKSVNDAETRKVAGVQQTVALAPLTPPYQFKPLGGIAVIADSTWAAMEGRKKLKIEWEPGEHGSYDSDAYRKEMLATARGACKVEREAGNVDAEFAKGGKVLEAEYYAPHLSHAPMEPPAAVAEFKDGKVYAWAPVQNPQAAQDTVAQALGIDRANVICNVTLLGGGFGRKSKPDFVAEAALLSKQLGKPVKVTWTREDDLHFDYFHSAAAMYMKAAVDAKGRPTAWLQRSVFPPIGAMFDAKARLGGAGAMGMGWTDIPWDIPNIRCENGPAEAHVRIGWLRSVANIYHAYAVHSFIDELAAAAGRDRVEYLLDVLGSPRVIELRPPAARNNPNPYPLDTGRTRKVVEMVAEQSGWAKKKSGNGRGWGIAVHRSFLSYVASVVEVVVDKAGNVRIPRVDTVVDLGKVVSPDRVKSQFEGAAVFGAGLAMMGEITAANGAIKQSNFHNYLVPRIHEAPYQVNVTLVASDAPPAGAGEPGVPPIAPAICNAIFAATGKRVRELPIRKTKLV